MKESALIVVGGLGALAGIVTAGLTIAGAAMSDSPSAADAAVSDAKMFAVPGAVGLVVVAGAFWFGRH